MGLSQSATFGPVVDYRVGIILHRWQRCYRGWASTDKAYAFRFVDPTTLDLGFRARDAFDIPELQEKLDFAIFAIFVAVFLHLMSISHISAEYLPAGEAYRTKPTSAKESGWK
ncbi:hypothetical protein L207DRAFT_67588 [Hyaloscypha variabilis F]|uniref:Uncharacterized protein n=1 Tax=Hyaloscypha variabilis (strain UAMH 11265 / GT02V1 / F) TaxID=1149755 RepID=A0A2J6RIQ0_HYAVF|nr:hypothetical protein L207DRAFT_67588 [Hyaloscypha variabilis F]